MRYILITLIFLLQVQNSQSQTCDDLIDQIEMNYQASTYTSYTSTAISTVSFYTVNEDFKTHYFAIVCFKQEYGYGCNKYIYKVSSDTKWNYSVNYLSSAGEAFWDYIQPYANVLGCGANFK